MLALSDYAPSASAVGEERTISFYNIHNKETLTVTYKKDGRFIPSAMTELNNFLRDWRRNEPTKMDPELIDLIWELRQELGSTAPTHLISGYRSPKTNAMLRRIGRKVARRSMHMRGQAADLYFPDVDLTALRNSALVRQVGGVGHYPRSGEHGFVHVDTGNVRHWPRLSKTALAAIFRDHKNKPKHEHRKNEKGPIYLVQRNRSTNSDSIAASADNVAKARTAAQNFPMPRPKPALAAATTMAAAVTPATATAVVSPAPAAKPEPLRPPVIQVATASPAETDVEPQDPPQLRRSLVFFPLAILKREALAGQLDEQPEERPVTVREVAALTSAPSTGGTVAFALIDDQPDRTLSASQLARVARQVVTRDGKSRLMMSDHERLRPNEAAKGEFLSAETTVIDLRGPSADQAPEDIEETVNGIQRSAQTAQMDAIGDEPVAIPVPAGASFSFR